MATIHETKDGKFVRDYSDPSQPQFVSLAHTLQRLEASPAPHLVIHLHGGLVSTEKGRIIGQQLARPLPDGIRDDAYEQISIVWGSGGFETVLTNYRELINERLFDRALKKLIQWASRRVLDFGSGTRSTDQGLVPQQVEQVLSQPDLDADSSKASEPFAINALPPDEIVEPGGAHDPEAEKELEELLSEDNELDALTAALDAELRPDDFEGVRAGISTADRASMAETAQKLDEEFLRTYREELAKAPANTRSTAGSIAFKALVKQVFKAGKALVLRYQKDRHHDLYPTAFEELGRSLYVGTIGSQIWSFMKTDTADHFKPDGAGTALLRQLSNLNAGLGDGRALRVTLLGHSAGSIFASEFLRALGDPGNGFDIPPVDVIFLAPAVDFAHFAKTLERAEGRMAQFHMYTMDDAREKEDWVFGSFYPRSLLYLISGALEFSEADDLIVGMDRFHRVDDSKRTYTGQERAALDKVRAFLDGQKARRIWSVTEGTAPPDSSSAIKHGDFDNDPDTLASVVHLCKTPRGGGGAVV